MNKKHATTRARAPRVHHSRSRSLKECQEKEPKSRKKPSPEDKERLVLHALDLLLQQMLARLPYKRPTTDPQRPTTRRIKRYIPSDSEEDEEETKQTVATTDLQDKTLLTVKEEPPTDDSQSPNLQAILTPTKTLRSILPAVYAPTPLAQPLLPKPLAVPRLVKRERVFFRLPLNVERRCTSSVTATPPIVLTTLASAECAVPIKQERYPDDLEDDSLLPLPEELRNVDYSDTHALIPFPLAAPSSSTPSAVTEPSLVAAAFFSGEDLPEYFEDAPSYAFQRSASPSLGFSVIEPIVPMDLWSSL